MARIRQLKQQRKDSPEELEARKNLHKEIVRLNSEKELDIATKKTHNEKEDRNRPTTTVGKRFLLLCDDNYRLFGGSVYSFGSSLTTMTMLSSLPLVNTYIVPSVTSIPGIVK